MGRVTTFADNTFKDDLMLVCLLTEKSSIQLLGKTLHELPKERKSYITFEME